MGGGYVAVLFVYFLAFGITKRFLKDKFMVGELMRFKKAVISVRFVYHGIIRNNIYRNIIAEFIRNNTGKGLLYKPVISPYNALLTV